MAKKINILEAIRQGQIGGGESHVLDLVEEMNKSLYNPTVLSFTDGPMVDRLTGQGIKCEVIPSTKPFDLSVIGKVKKLLIDNKIDIVHAHGTRAYSNVIFAARGLNLPIVYTIHGWSFHDDQGKLKNFISKFFEGYLTSKSKLNISVSESNQLTGKEAIKKFDSVVINNGVNFNKFDKDADYIDIRKELDIPSGDTLYGFIARITIQKNPLVLIKAFKKLSDKHDDVKLLMVGNGDMEDEMKSLIQELKLDGRVLVQDFRSDVPDILNALDVFCLPSLWEGLSIGLLEAMAMGKAIISTQVDGTKELIQTGENGLLAEANSVDDLFLALEKLHLDKQLREKLGEQAYITVKENFNVASMVRQVEGLYEEIA
ncbi:glycosyltransferase family 4 protein [Fulvivirga ligni]|uniref:glycosyltransferase family 4 protein n=1 Tax=Fulvivirga ligni TaxID=2904246 RepID=UPI001F45EEC3|nr:glycosyltransferase family 4 protein [Fulvivirga ligni]UII19710.1 glycosyltransferase family 4 protein [Fulvivirga ligni]